jgi:hypothetical protein
VSKKYLVYICSNHEGLDQERNELCKVIAKLGAIPVSVPFLPEGSPYDWPSTKQLIDDADYFVCLLGDNYGPLSNTGISYIHKEVVYAQSKHKPIVSFLKNSMSDVRLSTSERQHLDGFKNILIKSMFKYWHLRVELITHVKNSLSYLFTSKPQLGWQNIAPAASDTQKAAPQKVPLKASARDFLAKSRQSIPLRCSAKVFVRGNFSVIEQQVPIKLDEIFLAMAPQLVHPTTEDRMRGALEDYLADHHKALFSEGVDHAHAVADIKVLISQFQLVKVQIRALGLIEEAGAIGTWRLTSLGDQRMNALLVSSVNESA